MSTQVIVAGPRNGITVQKIEAEIFKTPLQVLTSPKSYSGQSSIVIEGFDFRKLNSSDQKQCNVTDCVDITIRRCVFGDKTTLGQGLNITGDKTKRVLVEYCIFEDMSYTESNGGEPCRLGNSQHSGCVYECVVKNSIFRNLKSDPEVISIKSSKNTVEDCFFIGNKSNVTVRHGGLDTIQHNYFRGSNGVRIHGYGNKVLYNCFEDNPESSTSSYAPIVLRYGNAEKDPNYTDVRTPSGQEGNSHAVYARTVDTVVDGNEFKNCRAKIIELAKGASLKPIGTKLGNNPVVTEFKFNKPVVVQEPTQTQAKCEICGDHQNEVKTETHTFCAKDRLRIGTVIKNYIEYEKKQAQPQA